MSHLATSTTAAAGARAALPRRKRLTAAKRRGQLMAVATGLFAERGYAATTTREIAEAAGVTEAVIFKHFAHKDDLYEAILEQKAREAGTETWVAELQAAEAAGRDGDVIRCLLKLIMSHSRQDPQFLRLMFHAALDHRRLMRQFRNRHLGPLYQELVRFIEAGQRSGRFRAGNSHVLARVLLAVPSYHAMLDSLLDGDALGHVGEEAIDMYEQTLLDALSAPSVRSARSRVPTKRKRLPRD